MAPVVHTEQALAYPEQSARAVRCGVTLRELRGRYVPTQE